jgi:ABC-type Fe3+ transport system substrate-binding protein
VIRGARHPRAARKLVDYMLSLRTECALAESGSGQVPLRRDARCRAPVKGPQELRTMTIGPEEAAEVFDEAMAFVEQEFLD